MIPSRILSSIIYYFTSQAELQMSTTSLISASPGNSRKIQTSEELNAVLYTAAECLRILSLYIYPVMPRTQQNIAEQLGLVVDF